MPQAWSFESVAGPQELREPLAAAVHTDFEPFGVGAEPSVKAVAEWRAGRFRDCLGSLWYQNRIIVSSMMVRRSAFIRAGGFRAGLFYPADWMLWTA